VVSENVEVEVSEHHPVPKVEEEEKKGEETA